MSNADLKQLVFESLSNAALENDYQWVLTEDPMLVAMDLIAYDADLEDREPEELVPYIEEWQEARKEKPSP